MRINHNISALNAWRSINQINYSMSKTLERLSSGLRINRAGDDAAGLAISEKMRGQIKGLNMAIKNAQDAISLIQTAEGALTEVHSILQRMRELAVQASSDTNTDVDREQIQKELDQLREEIDRIAKTTEFNTKKLLDGKLESFRYTPDVKVVTGGNINLRAYHASEMFNSTYTVKVGWYNGDTITVNAETVKIAVHTTDLSASGNANVAFIDQADNQSVVTLTVNYSSSGTVQLVIGGTTVATAAPSGAEVQTVNFTYNGKNYTVVLDKVAASNTADIKRIEILTSTQAFRWNGDANAQVEYVAWHTSGNLNATYTVQFTVGGETQEAFLVALDPATNSQTLNITILDTSNHTIYTTSVTAASVDDTSGVIRINIGDYILNINPYDLGTSGSTIIFNASTGKIYVTTYQRTYDEMIWNNSYTDIDKTISVAYDMGTLNFNFQKEAGSNTIVLYVTDPNGELITSQSFDSSVLTSKPDWSFNVNYGGETLQIYIDFSQNNNNVFDVNRIEILAARKQFRLPTDSSTMDHRYVAWYTEVAPTDGTATTHDVVIAYNSYTLANYKIALETLANNNYVVFHVYDQANNELASKRISMASVDDLSVITLKPESNKPWLFNINFLDTGDESIGNTTAIVYVTTEPVNASETEGTYIAEVGQFVGESSSELDVRFVKSDASGVTVLKTVGLSQEWIFQNNIFFLWDEFDFGDTAVPDEEVVDSAVARAEGINLNNNQLLFQIGANEGHNMMAGIDSMLARDLGITEESLDVTDQNKAERTIMIIDAAIHRVSTARAALGAIQNRLEHTIANLGVAAENLTAAESRIRDADMAKEMMQFTKQQILLQSSMAMLAQANTMPQNVLQLMR